MFKIPSLCRYDFLEHLVLKLIYNIIFHNSLENNNVLDKSCLGRAIEGWWNCRVWDDASRVYWPKHLNVKRAYVYQEEPTKDWCSFKLIKTKLVKGNMYIA